LESGLCGARYPPALAIIPDDAAAEDAVLDAAAVRRDRELDADVTHQHRHLVNSGIDFDGEAQRQRSERHDKATLIALFADDGCRRGNDLLIILIEKADGDAIIIAFA